MKTLNWRWKAFHDLSAIELHAILLLRAQVFVVEQNCVYQDPDTDDLCARHLLGKDQDELVAYCRIVVPQNSEYLKIGRVVVAKDHRQYGLGKEVIHCGVERCKREYPEKKIFVSAQAYLLTFYTNLGFVVTSEVYDEDGIDHVDMVYLG